MFFIQLHTRRVHLAGVTANPTGAWVAQQARNLAVALDEEATVVRFLIRDRDSKFTRAFDDVWHGLGAQVIRTPIQAPNANSERCQQVDASAAARQLHRRDVLGGLIHEYERAA